jgi:hypothetical protein
MSQFPAKETIFAPCGRPVTRARRVFEAHEFKEHKFAGSFSAPNLWKMAPLQ